MQTRSDALRKTVQSTSRYLPGGENVLERSESWNCFLFFPVTVLNCVAAPGMVSNQFRIFVARFYPRVILGRRVDVNRVRALLGARVSKSLGSTWSPRD